MYMYTYYLIQFNSSMVKNSYVSLDIENTYWSTLTIQFSTVIFQHSTALVSSRQYQVLSSIILECITEKNLTLKYQPLLQT